MTIITLGKKKKKKKKKKGYDSDEDEDADADADLYKEMSRKHTAAAMMKKAGPLLVALFLFVMCLFVMFRWRVFPVMHGCLRGALHGESGRIRSRFPGSTLLPDSRLR